METLKNIGKINIRSDVDDGAGQRIAKDFLYQFFVELAKQSSRYINSVYEAPFTYREKQLHSIIAPAISKITDSFLMEYPVERKWSKIRTKNWEDYHGWVDYWCRYRNVDFFIELKHNYDCYKNGTIRQDTFDNWEYMNKIQLKIIQETDGADRNIMLIPLHIVVVYEKIGKHKESESTEDIDGLTWIQDNYHDNLKPKPNWSGLWILNSQLVNSCYTEIDNCHEYYPALLIVSKTARIKWM